MKVKLFVAYEVTSHDAGSSFRTFENAKEALEHIEINHYLTENYHMVEGVSKADTDTGLIELMKKFDIEKNEDLLCDYLYLTGDGKHISYIVDQVIMIEESVPGTWKEVTKEELMSLNYGY